MRVRELRFQTDEVRVMGRPARRACKWSSYWTATDSAEGALAAYAGCVPTGRQQERPERSRWCGCGEEYPVNQHPGRWCGPGRREIAA
ncbi:MAG: hypothetical protein WAL68_18520, partial [Candidatus Binatus sp.]